MMELKHRAQFGNLLLELGLIGSAVEIGVAEGAHARTLVRQPAISQLYLIDAWQHLKQHGDGAMPQSWHDGNFEKTKQNIAGYEHKVVILKGQSGLMIPKLPDDSLIFAYLDGDHSYSGCLHDLIDIYPKLKKGAILAGHDFLNVADYGVNRAVKVFLHNEDPACCYELSDIHVTGEEDENDASFWLIKK